MEKFKAGAIRGIQSHVERERESKTNPDIDYAKTGENYTLVAPHTGARIETYMRAIRANIDDLNLKKAVRKDAVLACSFVITSSQDFFAGKTREEQRAFFADTVEFFKDRYGEKNVISAKVHMDEATPHMHLLLTPIRDGRLSAKRIFDREELRSLQTDLHASVGKLRGMQRGVEGSAKTHLTEARFKAEKAIEAKRTAEEKLAELEPKILNAEEVTKIHGKKTLLGGLKGVTYAEYESLRQTADAVDDMKTEVVSARKRAAYAAKMAGKAQNELADARLSILTEQQRLEKERQRVAEEMEKTPSKQLLQRNAELREENALLKTALRNVKKFVRDILPNIEKHLPEGMVAIARKITASRERTNDQGRGIGR